MRITLLGILVVVGVVVLIVYAADQLQRVANQAKAETDEQFEVANHTNPEPNGLG